jgi:hypothetical protein
MQLAHLIGQIATGELENDKDEILAQAAARTVKVTVIGPAGEQTTATHAKPGRVAES